jgi:hypothetical protein
MEIKSFLIKQEGQLQYMAFDSVTSLGSFYCSLGVGKLVNNEPHLTEIAAQALYRIGDISQPNGSIHLVEIKSQSTANSIIPKAFLNAKPLDAIFFICANDKVYDYVSSKLNIQKYSPYEAKLH